MEKLKAILLSRTAKRLYWNFLNGVIAMAIVWVGGLNIWWAPLAFAILNGATKEINAYLSEE